MADEIIRELWRIKDAIAAEHDQDVDSLVAALRTRRRPEGQEVVDLTAQAAGTQIGPKGEAKP
ncbi:MAG: hypothetical protein AB1505_36800 [Candidatus Latescibacterota bacterium]